MIPFTPHLAYECLEKLNCSNMETWPTVKKQDVQEDIKFAVQINGKTRDILVIKKNADKTEIEEMAMKSNKIKKYVENKKILKVIFVKNRILNYIIS